METKRFSRRIENFKCANCGSSVEGDGYRNHCPKCLWSRHVDMNPGDRALDCSGYMEPVGAEIRQGRIRIAHRCLRCHKEKTVKAHSEDNEELISELILTSN